MTNSTKEIEQGDRFAFGENWSNFLEVLDEERISQAVESLQLMLGLERLDNMTFLDIGCGSGLFSLAAWRMGATVWSFDFDAKSVSTTIEMKRRFCDDEDRWSIESGSVLDRDYLGSLGQYDIVYSWGVLHHTGNMKKAMHNAASLVAPCGHLYIALYNDQGTASKFWSKIKRLYCTNIVWQKLILLSFFPVFSFSGLVSDLISKKNPLARYSDYRKKRGMSLTHDWIDWLGGYPFEVAKPEEVFDFYQQRNFRLNKLKTCQTIGCNEFVFIKY